MLTLLSDKINKILNILFIFFLLKYYTFIIKKSYFDKLIKYIL